MTASTYVARRMAQLTPIRMYPEGRAPVVRKYPCVVCGKPNSAVRVGTRCRDHSDHDQRTRGRVRTRPVVREAPVVAWYDNDSDIATYRVERDRVALRDAEKRSADAAAIEEARRMLASEIEKCAQPRQYAGRVA